MGLARQNPSAQFAHSTTLALVQALTATDTTKTIRTHARLHKNAAKRIRATQISQEDAVIGYFGG